MTQRLKPIWIYLSHKFLPLFTLQWPHSDDNSVSPSASTEAVRPKKLCHSRHKLHWNRSTDSSATSGGKTDTAMAASRSIYRGLKVVFFHKTLFHIIHTFIYILTVHYQQSSWAHHTFHKYLYLWTEFFHTYAIITRLFFQCPHTWPPLAR